MEIHEHYAPHLLAMAKRMPTRAGWWPRLRYHHFADAVYYSDECPPRSGARDEDDALRIVLRYRTSLVLGAADEQYRPTWEAARHAFPDWIGFTPRRATPDPRVCKFYRRRAEYFDKLTEELLGDG
jgi:hypothetical protein